MNPMKVMLAVIEKWLSRQGPTVSRAPGLSYLSVLDPYAGLVEWYRIVRPVGPPRTILLTRYAAGSQLARAGTFGLN